jgi:hypothetical protein
MGGFPRWHVAGLAYIFALNGFRWLASRSESLDSLDALDSVNSPIGQAMVMESELLGSKTLQTPDYCRRRGINPQLPLAFDCYILTSGPGQCQFSSF